MFVYIRDLTDVRRREEEMRAHQRELSHMNRFAILGELAAGLAHELNQPLSGIRTRAQLLAKMVERGKAEPPKILDTQQHIMELVDRISRIIHHMRIFARQDQLRFAPFQLTQSIDGALSLLGEQLRIHAIEITKDIPEDLPRVLG